MTIDYISVYQHLKATNAVSNYLADEIGHWQEVAAEDDGGGTIYRDENEAAQTAIEKIITAIDDGNKDRELAQTWQSLKDAFIQLRLVEEYDSATMFSTGAGYWFKHKGKKWVESWGSE